MRRVLAEHNLGAVPAVFRAAAGLSLYEVADLVDRSRYTIGSYELGNRRALHDDEVFGQFAAAVDLPYLAMLPYLFRNPGVALAGDRVLRAVLEALGVDVDRREFVGLAAGNHALSRRLHAGAQVVAGEARDRVLTAHVLTNSSVVANHMAQTGPDRGPARAGLQLSCQAADSAHRTPVPRLRAMIAYRHARSAALLGDRAAFRSAITRARRELDRGSRVGEPVWAGFVDEAEITHEEGAGHVFLGEFARGEELSRRVLGGELSPRRRANYGADLALSLLGQGASQDAIEAGTTVLTALENGVTSGMALNKLRPVRVAARRADDEEFCARFDALERTLITA